MDALVCIEPGELDSCAAATRRTRPTAKCWSSRAASASAAPTITSMKATSPSCNYPRVMGHELAVEVVEAPGGSGLDGGRDLVVNPYLSCGTCIACRDGKPNCCTKIAVLGVHRDGGMTGLISLPPKISFAPKA